MQKVPHALARIGYGLACCLAAAVVAYAGAALALEALQDPPSDAATFQAAGCAVLGALFGLLLGRWSAHLPGVSIPLAVPAPRAPRKRRP